MQIFDVLKQKTYLSIAIVSSVTMFFFLPFVQSLGLHVDLWYKIIPPFHFALFVIFVAVFGMFVSFQIYEFMNKKACDINREGTVGGAIGSAFAFIVGVCPACIGFAGLFLPLGVVTTLVVFGPVFIIISIVIILISIYLNGGFEESSLRKNGQ